MDQELELELDMPALAALATSRTACEALVAGRRPGVTRLVLRPGGHLERENVGFPGRGSTDGMGRIKFGMTSKDAAQEIERQASEAGWDE